MAPTRQRGTLTVVASLLFVAGWATNHFAAMIPVLRDREGLSATVLAGAFGVYALGLLPGLLGGGGLSDRVGRRRVVLTGCAIAAGGNLLMLVWHDGAGIFAGRLVVGAGVGLAMSAGTAWAGDLAGRHGTTVAGTTLTAGFACGPLVSGLVAQFLPSGAALVVPFVLTITLSLVSVLVGWRATTAEPVTVGRSRAGAPPAPVRAGPRGGARERTVGRALARSVPMAVWVFASVTVPVLVLASRVGGEHNGPWLPGVACALALGTGVAVQIVARRAEWGPRAGIVGAGLAAVGFAVSAVVDTHQGVALFVVASVVLGSAYGLCLRVGLMDVEALTPPEHRGITIGVYYVCTYLGFGLPVLLEGLRSPVGTTAPLLVLAGLAVAAAALRTVQLGTVRISGPARIR
ncbi:MFS transporter [Nocardioides panzhihuensis]|uniref:MFS family permease n=1 Tax=Nocardioides panzhihuensis TaxID=860243 RepID=A0A7Z0DHN2_9ACTN|nr:MFS family permease [Nocardioides panzhihuensis]